MYFIRVLKNSATYGFGPNNLGPLFTSCQLKSHLLKMSFQTRRVIRDFKLFKKRSLFHSIFNAGLHGMQGEWLHHGWSGQGLIQNQEALTIYCRPVKDLFPIFDRESNKFQKN